MRRALSVTVLGAAALLHPLGARASGLNALGAYADFMGDVFGVGLELGLLYPFANAAVLAGEGRRISTGWAVTHAVTGTLLGGLGVWAVASSRQSDYGASSGWLGVTLTATLLGLGGLGFGALGERPRDAWIGASAGVSGFVVSHAALVWAGRGDRTGSIAGSGFAGAVATFGAVALAATSEGEAETAALCSLAALTAAATASQFVWWQRRIDAGDTSRARRPALGVAPSLMAGGASVSLLGAF